MTAAWLDKRIITVNMTWFVKQKKKGVIRQQNNARGLSVKTNTIKNKIV